MPSIPPVDPAPGDPVVPAAMAIPPPSTAPADPAPANPVSSSRSTESIRSARPPGPGAPIEDLAGVYCESRHHRNAETNKPLRSNGIARKVKESSGSGVVPQQTAEALAAANGPATGGYRYARRREEEKIAFTLIVSGEYRYVRVFGSCRQAGSFGSGQIKAVSDEFHED
jgi:hypothetical protein